MLETKAVRPSLIYGIVAWMALNIVLMVFLLLNGDTADFNNWLEIGLWSISIAGLLSMRKWGAAFAVFALSYTFATSLGNVVYFGIWINIIRVVINAPLIAFLFLWIFHGKFK